MTFFRRLVPVFLFFVLGIILYLFQPQVVHASCANPLTLTEYRKQADIVVAGTATIVVDNDAFISVDQYYKGHGPDTIRVTGKVSDTGQSSIEYRFEEGQKYLLFMQFGDTDQLHTTMCMGNKLLAAGDLSAEDKAALGRSKLSLTPTGSIAFHSEYKMSGTSLLMMVVSGTLLCVLLLISVVNDKKKKLPLKKKVKRVKK